MYEIKEEEELFLLCLENFINLLLSKNINFAGKVNWYLLYSVVESCKNTFRE